MGFCGDAMKMNSDQANDLIELQRLKVENRNLESKAKELSVGGQMDSMRDALLAKSGELNLFRSAHEELSREKNRFESDLDLVEKRIAKDKQLLTQAFSQKEISGLTHELDTLAARKSALEDSELEIIEKIEISALEQSAIEAERELLDEELEAYKVLVRQELAALKALHSQNLASSQSIEQGMPADLLGLFNLRFARGIAIGKLLRNTCGACNMTITSTALSALHLVPNDEVASCPVCAAILVRV
jgi:predicted  nucleic acid-binding Zn-ribbon protein